MYLRLLWCFLLIGFLHSAGLGYSFGLKYDKLREQKIKFIISTFLKPIYFLIF